jgi:carbon-monoxide dehydrogenase small subunit
MTLGFILNGEDVIADTEPVARLVDILRESFNLTGTKAGCCIGNCGACMVIFNGDVVKACLVPAYIVRGGEVVTMEGFSQTDEYLDIISAFEKTGAENCGFCNTGKILAMESLLEITFNKQVKLSRTEILAGFHGIRCRCTESDQLVQAFNAAIEYRSIRLGRKLIVN